MRILRNVKIKGKLTLMLVLPLIVLLYFSQAEIRSRWSILTEMTNLRALSELAVSSSNLVHELQKERGATAGFLGSKGQKFSSELKKQRQSTDQKAADLKKTLAEFDRNLLPLRSQSGLRTVMATLGKISTIRNRVDGFNIAIGEAIRYYSGLNAGYLAISGSMAEVTTDADYLLQLVAYTNFLQAKERAGIERAVISNTFAADRFAPGMFRKFNFLMAKQEAFTDAFLSVATQEHIDYFNRTLSGEFVDEVERMRSVALAKASEGNFGVDATYWFKTITGKINLLKDIEDFLSNELRAESERLGSEAGLALWTISIVILLVLGVTILVVTIVVRSITGPVSRISKIAQKIAAGDVQHSIEVDSNDEIGILAASFKQLIVYLQELSAVAKGIADNDLTAKIEPKSDKDVLGTSFKAMQTNLVAMVRKLGDNARELTSAANEITSSSEQMSRGAKEQSNQVSHVSTAVEEMTANIVESSKNAGKATDSSRSASETATTGGQLVSDTIQGMQKIADVVSQSAESITKLATSADEIGEIVSVIDDIADQTNLLALNAAIEAARAGEQGRGFAVVADEVRKLAERTGKATGEITIMIKGIQDETNEAVNSMKAGVTEVEKGRELADKAGSSLNEIVQLSTSVLEMIQQIATATEEQSTTAEQISKNVESVAAIARETSQGAEQSATAAEQLSRQAEDIQKMVSEFKIE